MDEFEIPIDINTNKLLEWLVSRRHVSKDWTSQLIPVREKINNAIQDMPAHEGIVKLLSGQHINYFHCLKIVEILKETEADTKNLFGGYGSRRMKDWQDIVSSYQRENLYLAEAAQILIRNVCYEVPSLKKKISTLDQRQIDCEKQIKDISRIENSSLTDFNNTCKQLGIPGNKIRSELIELLDDIPLIYKKFCDLVKPMEPAVDLYKAFVNFQVSKEDSLHCLPMLSYLLHNGNTTTYEYTYGEKPVSIDEPVLNLDIDEGNNDSIDFGDDIDFGDNVQIDFAVEAGDVASTPLSEGCDIDWGAVTTDEEFEMVDHLDVNLEESGIVVEKTGLDGGIASGNEAYTILDNPTTREQILNNILELIAFLKMRLFEMSSNNDLLSMSQLDVPSIMQMQNVQSIAALTDIVILALEYLNNKRVQHLHNIKHSPKYVDLLTGSLKQKLEVVERMKARKEIVEDKIKEAKNEAVGISPVIKKIIDTTKKLQIDIQLDISKKYKGRVVNIIGAVNLM